MEFAACIGSLLLAAILGLSGGLGMFCAIAILGDAGFLGSLFVWLRAFGCELIWDIWDGCLFCDAGCHWQACPAGLAGTAPQAGMAAIAGDRCWACLRLVLDRPLLTAVGWLEGCLSGPAALN